MSATDGPEPLPAPLPRTPDQTKARQALESAVQRVRALSAAELTDNLVAAHNLAWKALVAQAPELARSIYERVAALETQPRPRDAWEWRRLAVSISQPETPARSLVQQRQALYDDALRDFGADDARTRMAWRELADALWFLGHTLDDEHRYDEAVDAHWNAYLIRTNVLGPLDVQTRRSCYETAELSRVLRRFEEAEHYFLLTLEAGSAAGNEDPEFAALVRNNLGEMYTMAGRYEEARARLDEALAMREKSQGPDSERAWRSRVAIARLLVQAGDAAGALALAREALKRSEHAGDSSWYLVLANALLATGNHEEAQPIYRKMLEQIPLSEIDRGIFLDSYLEIVEGLARCHMAQSAWPEAAASAGRVLEVARQTLPSLLQQAAEAQITHVLGIFLTVQSLWLWALLRGGVATGAAVSDAFEMVELTKGLRTRYIRLRQPGDAAVLQILAPQEQQELERVTGRIRVLIEQLVQEDLSQGDAGARVRSRSAIARRAELRFLERDLAQTIGDLEVVFDLAPALSERLLPKGSAGLEIVQLRDCVRSGGASGPAADRYVAFAVGDDGVASLHDIGLVDEIDGAIGEMRRSVMSDQSRPEAAWRKLSIYLGRKLLRGCWPRLRDARNVIVGCDGAFGALPLELLTSPEERYWLDHAGVSYCIRLAELARKNDVFRKGGPPLVLAAPDFDLPNAFTERRVSLFGLAHSLRKGLGSNRFAHLEGSREEGLAIARLLGTEALTGEWTLVAELMRNESPEILHIATHGFVLPREGLEDDRLSLAAPSGNALDKRMVLEDSLQRSGLAMAGANAVLEGRQVPVLAVPGMVYASDIQQLDLQQTDLVVLAACRSGLGEIDASDGAHGLRRAFLAAGCRSVVSALWDVPDESSRQLLEAFYTSVLAGQPRLAALREARETVRRQHPDDPLHWAGFVLDGAIDPLFRFSPLADLKGAVVSLKAWGITSAANTDAIHALGTRIVQGDDVKVTVAAVRRLLAGDKLTDTQRAELLHFHGDTANHLGDNARAVADYEAILALHPDPPLDRGAIKYNIAKIRWQMGQREAALAGYTDALAEAQGRRVRAMLHVNRGLAYMMMGDAAAALADMGAVLDDPESPKDQKWMAFLNRASILRESDPDSALQDVASAEALGVASEAEMLRLRSFRVELLMNAGQREKGLSEIASLIDDPGLTEELREHLSHWRQQASLVH